VSVRGSPLHDSPTGAAHIGGLKTALFCYLYAKKHGGDFIVRIEDTDTKRTVDGAVDFIYDSLDWLGLKPDASTRNTDSHGPYIQSDRNYNEYIKYLLDNDLVYYAFDTDDDLNNSRKSAEDNDSKFIYNHTTRMLMKNSISLTKEDVDKLIIDNVPYTIRFKTPRNIDVTYVDEVYGTITVNSDTLDDKVLVKSDGIPTYHLANICDDHDMYITHVIRGNEWISSTPLHCLLYDSFGWDRPVFVHLPLIVDENGKKISKRSAQKHGYSVYTHRWTDIDEDGEIFTLDGYSDMGFEPEALISYLATLGWSPKDDNTDILSMDELINRFDLNGLNKANARWDLDKLKYINSHYVNKLPSSVILDYIDDTDYTKTKLDYYNDNNKIDAIFDVAKVRAIIKKDLKPIVDIFFNTITEYINYKFITDDYKKVMHDVLTRVKSHDFDNIDDVKNIIYKSASDNDVKFGAVMKGLRVAITGGISGPDLMITMSILGYNDSIKRIQDTL